MKLKGLLVKLWIITATCLFASFALAQGLQEPDRLLANGSFADLDQRANAAQSRYESGLSDDRALTTYAWSLASPIPALQEKFDAWVSAFPNSYAARYSRATYLLALAWAYRGDGYSHDTSAARFTEFSRLLRKSEEDLERSLQLTAKPVPSLAVMIRSAIARGDRALAEKLYEKAIALDRKAMEPRRSYMWGLQPKWGGSVAALDAFLAKARADGLSEAGIHELEADYWTFMSNMAYMAGDVAKALELADRAVAAGPFADALIERAGVRNVRKEYALAIEDLSQAIARYPQSAGRVYRMRASAYQQTGRFAEAVADYRVAAERGDTWSQTRLGGAYGNGELRLKKDLAEAFRWYILAAVVGDRWAQSSIAEMYYLGTGVERNYAEAARWAQASAEQQHPHGQNVLGIILWYGNGLPQDEEEAIRLWRLAAKKGSFAAQANLQRLPSAWQRARIFMQDAVDSLFPQPGGK